MSLNSSEHAHVTIMNQQIQAKLLHDSLYSHILNLLTRIRPNSSEYTIGMLGLRIQCYFAEAGSHTMLHFQLVDPDSCPILDSDLTFTRDESDHDVVCDCSHHYYKLYPKLRTVTCTTCNAAFIAVATGRKSGVRITSCYYCRTIWTRVPLGPIPAGDLCVICHMELGDTNISTYECHRHLGHIACISNYYREYSRRPPEQRSHANGCCPMRCPFP